MYKSYQRQVGGGQVCAGNVAMAPNTTPRSSDFESCFRTPHRGALHGHVQPAGQPNDRPGPGRGRDFVFRHSRHRSRHNPPRASTPHSRPIRPPLPQ